jgi:hypothetical protein
MGDMEDGHERKKKKMDMEKWKKENMIYDDTLGKRMMGNGAQVVGKRGKRRRKLMFVHVESWAPPHRKSVSFT